MERTHEITPEALLAHSDWIRRLACSLVFDPSRADDVVQETWRVALERPPEHGADLRAWLATVARNIARKLGRSESSRRRREEAVAQLEALPDTVSALEKAQLQGRMVQAVLALKEPYRTPVLMRFFDELPPREIAKQLDRPVDTIRTQIARGIDSLRGELDREYGDRSQWGLALLPLLRGHETAALQGSVLLKSGGLIMLWKWLIPVTATLVALFVWNETQEDVPAPAGASLVSPDAELVHPEGETASAAASERESINTGPMTEAPELIEKSDATYTAQGIAVDLTGQTLAGLPLSFSEGRTWDVPTEVHSFTFEPILEEDSPAPFDGVDEPFNIVTEDDGSFTIDLPFENALPRSTDTRFLLLGDGFRTNEQGREQRYFIFAPTTTLQGRAVDENGSPLEDVAIDTSAGAERVPGFPWKLERPSNHWSWRSSTDAAGNLLAEHFPRVPGLRFTARKRGYASKLASVSWGEDELLDITLERAKPNPQITGRVVDEMGLPVAGATVSLYRQSTTSQPNGEFVLKLRSTYGDGPLAASIKGHVPDIRENFLEKMRADESIATNLILRIGGPTKSITGRVIDHRGRPQRGVEIILHGTPVNSGMSRYIESAIGTGSFQNIKTDSKGEFEVPGLFQDGYSIVAYSEKHKMATRRDSVSPGTTDLELVLDLESRIKRLDGQVVDRNGLPVAGAQIGHRVVDFKGNSFTSSRMIELDVADDDGRFSLRNFSLTDVELCVWGSNMDMHTITPEELELRPLQLVVPVNIQFQIDPSLAAIADRIQIVDESGELLSFDTLLPDVISQSNSYRLRNEGAIPTIEVSDRAAELLLIKDREIVRRIPLELRTNEIVQIR